MPIEKIKKIDANKIIGIWKIEEDLSTLLEQVKSDREDGSIAKITSKNKLKEWCAVRITAETLSRYLDINYQGIRKDEFGKPFLMDSHVHLSISHSYPYVALIMDKNQDVGIDIEFLESRILRLAPKFMSDQELIYANNQLLTSGLIWSAKEALYKYHGRKKLLFSKQLLIEKFDPESDTKFYGKIIDGKTEKHELEFVKEQNLIFVYTVNTTQ